MSEITQMDGYNEDVYVEVLRQRRINAFLVKACLICSILATAGTGVGVTGLLFKRHPTMVALSVAGESGRAMVLRPLPSGERQHMISNGLPKQ